MTIEDLIESGIEIQGKMKVQVWDGNNSTFPFESLGDVLGVGYSLEPWYCEYPITYLWIQPGDDYFTIEVDGEEQQ